MNIVLQDECPANPSDHITVAIDPVVTRLAPNALDPAYAAPVGC